MKFLKKIIQGDKLLKSLSICAIFFSMQNFIAFGSEDKSNQMHKSKNNYNFEEIFFGNSISFYEYDNFESQLKIFFGLKSVLSETSFYPDLSISSDAEVIRRIYRSKLNDMMVEEKIHFSE